MKIAQYMVLAVCIVLSAAGTSHIYRGKLATVNAELANAKADADSLQTLQNGVQRRMAGMARSISGLESIVGEQNQELLDVARDRDEKAQAYITIRAQLEAVQAQGVATTVVYIDTSTGLAESYEVRGHYSQPGISIDLVTRAYVDSLRPGEWEVEATLDDIDVGVLLTQNKAGGWDTIVKTPTWVKLGDLATTVLAQKPGYWARNRHWFYLGSGAAGTLALVQEEPLLLIPAGVVVLIEALRGFRKPLLRVGIR